jgi:hypothetical protein
MAAAKPLYMSEPFFPFFDGNLFSLDITCVCSSLVVVIVGFLPEVREFITILRKLFQERIFVSFINHNQGQAGRQRRTARR